MFRRRPLAFFVIALQLTLFSAAPAAYGNGFALGCRSLFVSAIDKVDSTLDTDLRGRIKGLVEGFNQRYFDKNYEGETIPGSIQGSSLIGTVGQRIGRGWWGVVHKLAVVEAETSLKKKAPEWFVNGKLVPLVIKFPRVDDPWQRGTRRSGLLTEPDQQRQIMDGFAKIKIEPIPSPEIKIFINHAEMAVVKPEIIGGVSVLEMVRDYGKLPADAADQLFQQVFVKARLLYEETGLILDIQPGNLVWQPKTRTWELYEMGSLLDPGWLTPNFVEYLEFFYFEARQQLAQKAA